MFSPLRCAAGRSSSTALELIRIADATPLEEEEEEEEDDEDDEGDDISDAGLLNCIDFAIRLAAAAAASVTTLLLLLMVVLLHTSRLLVWNAASSSNFLQFSALRKCEGDETSGSIQSI